VFTTAQALIVNNPYEDQHFDQQVDQQTGFTTTSIACVPIIAMGDNVIGVLEVLNQQNGWFSETEIETLTEITAQCSATLHAFSLIERMEASKQREIEFMNLVSNLTTELDLGTLLNQVVDAATEMLHAERATVFLNDERTNELFLAGRSWTRIPGDPLPKPHRHRWYRVYGRYQHQYPARLRRLAV